ncbi:CD80-like immunoglobulin C2-set [Trinorchestia longiramus]|nr:CD80-like immunoglobulin C2-set [Trinorchestia longiramus]
MYLVECEAAGAVPPAVISWSLNGKPLTSHTTTLRAGSNTSVSTLRYEPVQADDGAQLECEAVSPKLPHRPLHDHWVLTVNFLPRATINLGPALSPSNIRTGDDVFLECQVRAKPWIYRLSWRHNGKEVHHNISSGVIVHNHSLVLQKLSRSQAGLYTCVGSNTEGDGESQPLQLQVRYAPECADNQAFIYDAARHEKVTVRCLLDAFPSNVTFRWRFNNSGEMVDISAEHIVTRGLESSLSYVARTDLDYGTLLCWGKNELGVQSTPCMYRVIPAELPRPPTNCTITSGGDVASVDYQANSDWNSETISTGKDIFSEQDSIEDVETKDEESSKTFKTGVLAIRCLSDNNLELPMKFTAMVYEADTHKLLYNVTNSSTPYFLIRSFDQVADLDITIYSSNNRGTSDEVVLKTRADVDIAEKRTAHVRHPPSSRPDMGEGLREGNVASETTDLLIPVLAVVLGVLGSLGLLAVVAVLLLLVRRSARRRTNVRTDTRTSSLPESPDSNPDVIPIYGEGEMSPRGMRRRGDGLECSPLCPSMSPHSPRLRNKGNMMEITYQDPIHPGAEFVISTALAQPLDEMTQSGVLQNPAIGARGGPALCPLNAHLCTATNITTAHHEVPASPCILRHHLPPVNPLVPVNCGGALTCRGYIPRRAPPTGVCSVCSTCDTTPLLPCSSQSPHLTACSSHPHSTLPYSTSYSPLVVPHSSHTSTVQSCSSQSPPIIFSSSFSPGMSSIASISQIGHIPPPVMFQKPSSQVHIPAVQSVATIGVRGTEAVTNIVARETEPTVNINTREAVDWSTSTPGAAARSCDGSKSGLPPPNFTRSEPPIDCQGCSQQPLLNFSRSPSGVAVSSCQPLQELTVPSPSNVLRPSSDASLAPDKTEAEIDDERLTESRV